MNADAALKSYKAAETGSKVAIADPHRLIDMLFLGAKGHLNAAIGHLSVDDMMHKGEAVAKALDIIEYLRVSLDPGIDNEFAETMASLYQYMGQRVSEANLENDAEKFQEVIGLINEIHEGWQGIPKEYRS